MITSNFSSVTLLANLPIIIKDDTNIFVCYMPTIEKEYGGAYNYNNLFYLCSTDLFALQEQFKDISFKSRYELIKKMISAGGELGTSIVFALGNIVENFEYVADSFRSSGKIISDEVFELICDYIAIACGNKDMTFLDKKEKEKEMTEEEREWEYRKQKNEERIRKAKQKAGKYTSLDTVLACICYEFNIPIKDLVQMNKYSVYFLYGKIGKISNYEVTKIAAGTGNLGRKNKHEYWTN